MNPTTGTSSPASGLIDATQLARLTGLSERRLRQLAQFGAIPQARRSRYPLAETLQGIFRYYRSQDEDAVVRDEYPSLKACAAATGIPLSTLERAKRQGCPGFRDGRVRLLSFLHWHQHQQGSSGIDLEAEQTLRLQLQNAKLRLVIRMRREAVLPVDVVRKLGADLGNAVSRATRRLHLLAPSIVGFPVEVVTARLKEAEDEICSLVDQKLDFNQVWNSLAAEAETLPEPGDAHVTRKASTKH